MSTRICEVCGKEFYQTGSSYWNPRGAGLCSSRCAHQHAEANGYKIYPPSYYDYVAHNKKEKKLSSEEKISAIAQGLIFLIIVAVFAFIFIDGFLDAKADNGLGMAILMGIVVFPVMLLILGAVLCVVILLISKTKN